MAYSEEKIAETLTLLDANDGNVSATHRESGVSRAQIQKWRDERVSTDMDRDEAVSEKRQDKREELTGLFEEFVTKAVGVAVDDGKLKAASTKDLLTAAGIAVDKILLLRGEPTSINDQRGGVNIFQQINPNGHER